MIRQIPVTEIKDFFIIKPHGLWHGEKLYKFGGIYPLKILISSEKLDID
jgi:hypothetical protein